PLRGASAALLLAEFIFSWRSICRWQLAPKTRAAACSMRRTDRRHRDSFFLRGHILAIYLQIPKITIASRKKVECGIAGSILSHDEKRQQSLCPAQQPCSLR